MITVDIKKPLYGSYCYIRDIYLNQAIKRGEKLKITIPQGSAIVDPKEWKKGHKMAKIFKDPKKPMILYGNTVPLPVEKGVVKEVTNQISLF